MRRQLLDNSMYVETGGVGKGLIQSLGYGRERKSIAVIDDDEDFGRLVAHIGREMGMDVEHFESLEEMGSVAKLGDFEGVILDFHLEKMNGVEIAEYLDSLFPWIPAILTSGDSQVSGTREMPECVDGFVPKENGAMNIIRAADWAIEKRRRAS